MSGNSKAGGHCSQVCPAPQDEQALHCRPRLYADRTGGTGSQDRWDWQTGQVGLADRTGGTDRQDRWDWLTGQISGTGSQDRWDWLTGQVGLAHRTGETSRQDR